jgi:hypothetical protein
VLAASISWPHLKPATAKRTSSPGLRSIGLGVLEVAGDGGGARHDDEVDDLFEHGAPSGLNIGCLVSKFCC